jgi:hypothetical protein
MCHDSSIQLVELPTSRDSACEICLDQYYRSVTSEETQTNKSLDQAHENDSTYYSSDEDILTALEEHDGGASTIGCVVGWPEDPGLFGDCLRNMKK